MEEPLLTKVRCCPQIRVTAEAQRIHSERQEAEWEHDRVKPVCCCMSCWDFHHTRGQVSVPGNELPRVKRAELAAWGHAALLAFGLLMLATVGRASLSDLAFFAGSYLAFAALFGWWRFR